ncbi:L-seryl-tRNA(Sec) selenium transferase [Marimonas sp. MJW-29]|uniref:L-seryl-tRNA(Sec) selenium transferase n=1 Tax=Sulfitobacter sediminis TaxID=3234186 RepID=A0ABV3RRQ6_9RHOB
MTNPLSDLPQIQSLLSQPLIAALASRYSHAETVEALRGVIDALRKALLNGHEGTLPEFEGQAFAAEIEARIEAARTPSLRPVINATGIIIHTNLGRARLAPQALAQMQAVASGASTLEYNLETGKRGSRHDHVEALICELTGAEAAVVVNNCAAAVMLSLVATASGRTVVASRGELVEIGGAFRLPDVIAQSGAVLREVGTTNKTRLSDYEGAIDAETAVLLKSHTSNFRIVGFTAAPDRRDLARLAQERGVILMEDLGSGVLIDLAPFGLVDEPVVSDILKAGVDLVMFSGDKLLGGPQAGIIAGRADIVAALRSHPLMRAVRIDKLSLAALEATLRLYRPPHDPLQDVPVLRALFEPIEMVRARAARLIEELRPLGLRVAEAEDCAAYVGGGTLPGQDLPSVAVAVAHGTLSAEALAARLRHAATPVIGRIERQRVLLDMRTVSDDELPRVAAALREIAAG